MLGYIDKNLEPKEYELILCKPDGTQLQVLSEAQNIQYSAKFPTTDELNFTIPYYIMDNGKKIKNPNWELIKGDYLVLLNEEKYFIIINPEDNADDRQSKTIVCYSREYELNKKIIRSYEYVSRKLYSPLPEKDDDGELRGVMNYITSLTSWSLDIPSFISEFDIINKYRSFSVSEKTLFDFLITDVQKTFGCIFIFDTINKKISVKNIEKLNSTKGLYISESNYIKTIKKKIKNDEIITRLYCYGKDDLSINKLNPTGVPYLEDFTYYKTTEYMSQDLIDALNKYDTLLETHRTSKTFEKLLADLELLFSTLAAKNNELSVLQADLEKKEDEIDSAIKLNQSLTTLNAQRLTIESNIRLKQAEIKTINNNISNKNNEIKNFRTLIAKENNFTSGQLSELDFFIREKTWSDSSYETEEDLYEESVKQLKRLSQPPIEFEVNIVDFLKIVECQHDWKKLICGDIVTIEYDDFDLSIDVRLVGYTHNDDNNDLVLQFSNKESLDDPFAYLTDLQKQTITTSTTIDMSKYKWDKSKDNESAIADLINNDLDASKNKVLAGKNQDVVVDRRGIWLTEKDDLGNIKPEQIRMINSSIVLSDDGFQTAKTAITGKGIVSSLLMGKTIIGQQGLFDGIDIFSGGVNPIVEIGKYLDKDGVTEKKGIRINGANLEITGSVPSTIEDRVIQAENQAKVYTDGIKISIDTQVSELNTSITNTNTYIDGAFKDGVISNAEAIAIKEHLKTLEKEKQDVDAEYNTLYINAYFTNKTALTNAKVNYNGDYATLVNSINNAILDGKIITTEKTAVENGFANLKTTLATLRSEIANTINQIQTNYANEKKAEANSYADSEISKVNNSLTQFKTTIDDTLSDGKVTSIEANSLKLSLQTAKKESEDLITKATTLLITTEKTNYSTSLTALETEINKWINQPLYPLTITTVDRNNILAKFQDVESKKSILVNKIMEIRETNANKYTDATKNEIVNSLGSMAYENLVEKAKLGTTVIQGGFIKSELLTANNIVTGTLDATLVNVTNLNASNITSGTIDGSTINVTNLNASNIKTGIIAGTNAKFDLVTGTFRLGLSDLNYKLKYDGTNLNFGSGVLNWGNVESKPNWIGSTSIDFSGVSSPYIFANNATIYGTLRGGTLSGTQIIQTSGSTILSELYKDAYGGKLVINDNYGYPTVALGCESGLGDNKKGTLTINKGYDSVESRRIELGISNSSDAGIINLRGSNGSTRVNIYAGSNLGSDGIIGLRDSLEQNNVIIRGEGITYFSGGMVGINTKHPSYELDVFGTMRSSIVRCKTYETFDMNSFSYKSGVSGTFTSGDKTITVINGIITNISL